MPRYAIVVTDAAKAHEAHIKTYERAYLRDGHEPTKARRLAEQKAAPRTYPVGTVWTHENDECPDGLPNCRHCGDPAHVDSCRAQGHCEHCGTRHGIAPASYLAAHGLELRPA